LLVKSKHNLSARLFPPGGLNFLQKTEKIKFLLKKAFQVVET